MFRKVIDVCLKNLPRVCLFQLQLKMQRKVVAVHQNHLICSSVSFWCWKMLVDFALTFRGCFSSVGYVFSLFISRFVLSVSRCIVVCVQYFHWTFSYLERCKNTPSSNKTVIIAHRFPYLGIYFFLNNLLFWWR